jgi:hypothetical protein
MSVHVMEIAVDEDQVRLGLRSSLLEYLERKMEHHDEFVWAVNSGTIHSRNTLTRLAELRARRDAALETHLDQLAESQGHGLGQFQ